MQDDFNLDEFENHNEPEKEEDEITPKDKFNNVLGYVPFLNVRLLFSENQWTKKVNKRYNRQWITIFLLYLASFFVVWIFTFKLSFILTLLYFWSVVFFAAKAYNGMYVEIEFIEKLMLQFEPKKENEKDKVKNTTVVDEKKDIF